LSARFIASLVGKIISMSRALGPVASLMKRSNVYSRAVRGELFPPKISDSPLKM